MTALISFHVKQQKPLNFTVIVNDYFIFGILFALSQYLNVKGLIGLKFPKRLFSIKISFKF